MLHRGWGAARSAQPSESRDVSAPEADFRLTPESRWLLLGLVIIALGVDLWLLSIPDDTPLTIGEVLLHLLVLTGVALFGWWPTQAAIVLVTARFASFGSGLEWLTTLALCMGFGLVVALCRRIVVLLYGGAAAVSVALLVIFDPMGRRETARCGMSPPGRLVP